MKAFSECTYLSQVRRLRSFALEALSDYSINFDELLFINHGENATFKVTTKSGAYLLRIHRNNYHNQKQINEELKWLVSLSKKSDIPVQKPVRGINGKFVQYKKSQLLESGRFYVLLEWQYGFIKKGKKTEKDYFCVGELMGKLHSKTIIPKHRHFWDSRGLAGKESTFGALSLLREDFHGEYDSLEKSRREIFSKLKSYEKRKSSKVSVIHADLHFGNMIWSSKGVAPIDFDDCGHGLNMYDLAVTLLSTSMYLKKVGKRKAASLRNSLFEGYNSVGNLTEADLEIIPELVRA